MFVMNKKKVWSQKETSWEPHPLDVLYIVTNAWKADKKSVFVSCGCVSLNIEGTVCDDDDIVWLIYRKTIKNNVSYCSGGGDSDLTSLFLLLWERVQLPAQGLSPFSGFWKRKREKNRQFLVSGFQVFVKNNGADLYFKITICVQFISPTISSLSQVPLIQTGLIMTPSFLSLYMHLPWPPRIDFK